LGRLATSDAEVNIRLLSRLAETAITSGDVKTAVEAVGVCTAEAENLLLFGRNTSGGARGGPLRCRDLVRIDRS
jgi:hypothetical protein